MIDIRHTLVIDAPVDIVFKAITTAKGLSAWWTPKTTAIPETGSIASFPFANGYVKKMEVQELQPNEFVKWHCIQGDQEWIGTIITFKLDQRAEPDLLISNPEVRGQIEQSVSGLKTLLIFEHKDWKDYSPSFAECSYTWAQFLRSLKLYCETGTGRPWPTQYSA